MSVSHRQYFLIRLQIVFGDNFRIHFLARQQFPQALRALKHSVLNRDINFGIDRLYERHIACRENVSCTPKASGRAWLQDRNFP